MARPTERGSLKRTTDITNAFAPRKAYDIPMTPTLTIPLHINPQNANVNYDVKLPKYAGRTLYVCTPLKDRRVDVTFMTAFLDASRMLEAKGLAILFHPVAEGGIVLARNRGLHAFLESAATDFLFLDDDLQFLPEAVEGLLDAKEDFVAGAYPARSTNWDLLFDRIRAGIVKSPEDAAVLSSPLQVRFENWTQTQRPEIRGRYIEATEVGAGAILLSRAAVERLAAASPKYLHMGGNGDAEEMHAAIVTTDLEELDGKLRWWGEDFNLCRKWRLKCGGRIWIDMLSRFGHTGPATFSSISIGEAITRERNG